MSWAGGVYVYRCRKPTAIFRIPLLSFHFAYVGETTSFRHRHLQHTVGGGRYGHTAQPWADLEPRCVLRIPLPPWKWLLHAVETLLILLLWPVYNHSKNLWNPRRIPLQVAKAMRAVRDGRRKGLLFFRVVHAVKSGLLLVTFSLLAYAAWLVIQ
jgi:hypothetical protein